MPPELRAPDDARGSRRFWSLDLLDDRYPSLHGVRVLAIVSVVQFHVTELLGEERLPIDRDWAISSYTVFFGMDLFFVLSGFLIGAILLKSLKDAAREGRTGLVATTALLRRFYLRRVLRTFPAYYVVLAVLVAAYGLNEAQRHNLVYEASYLTNFVPLLPNSVVMVWGWSLALEEQFYLTVPFLFFALMRLRSDRARIGLLVALCLLALAVRLGIYLRHTGEWNYLVFRGALYFRTYTRFDTLVAGILLAVLHDRYKGALDRALSVPHQRGALAVFVLACLWGLLHPRMFGDEHVLLSLVFAWGTITSVMYVALGLLLLHGTHGPLHRFVSRPVFRKIATLGYGVYLVHMPVCRVFVVRVAKALSDRGAPMTVVWPLAVALAVAGSLVVAYGIHLVIEKPAMRLRERWAA